MRNVLAPAFFFVVAGAIVASCAVWAVVSLGRHEYLTTIVVLGFGMAFLGLTTSLVLVMRGRVKPVVTFSDESTTVRPDRVVEGLLKVGMVGGYVGLATYAIFTPLGRIDLPEPPGNHQYLLFVAAAGALWGVVDLWRTWKRGGVSFVRLTPRGLEMSQGSSSMAEGWDDVEAITDRRPGKAPPFRAMVFVKLREGQMRTQVIDSYTPGGDALRKLVRFYWQHPEQRDELADGRARQRLAGSEAW